MCPDAYTYNYLAVIFFRWHSYRLLLNLFVENKQKRSVTFKLRNSLKWTMIHRAFRFKCNWGPSRQVPTLLRDHFSNLRNFIKTDTAANVRRNCPFYFSPETLSTTNNRLGWNPESRLPSVLKTNGYKIHFKAALKERHPELVRMNASGKCDSVQKAVAEQRFNASQVELSFSCYTLPRKPLCFGLCVMSPQKCEEKLFSALLLIVWRNARTRRFLFLFACVPM